MKPSNRLFTALMGCVLTCSAWAWGDKPIKLIVPAPPGGTIDAVARLVGQQLSAEIGQPVIVDNRPGAGGSIGIQAMLNAPADGNTLTVVASNVLAEIPHVMKLPYDPLKDVVPIASLGRSGMVLVSAASHPARDFPALLAELKSRKGKTSFATYSPGTVSHYNGLILSHTAGLDMQDVGYPGSPPALQALLGNQVDIMFDGMVTAVPLIKSGKLRAYAFSGKQRSRYLPDVPTVAEVGYPALQSASWVGMIAPAKLPPQVLAEIQAVMRKVAQSANVQEKLVSLSLEPEANVDTAALLRDTTEMFNRNAATVKKYGIKAN